jgi:hypothetical protein
MRQLISHLSDAEGASPLSAAMCRWVVAYCRSLKSQLTADSDLETELGGVLAPSELAQLLAAHHPSSFALSMLTELGAMAPLRESHRIRLDENLTFFEDAVGTCERILRTPIPLGYTRCTPAGGLAGRRAGRTRSVAAAQGEAHLGSGGAARSCVPTLPLPAAGTRAGTWSPS